MCWEAGGNLVHEGLIALDFLISGWEQKYKSSLFCWVLCFASNRDTNVGSSCVWLCLSVKGKASLFSAGSLSFLPCFYSQLTISQCIRVAQSLPHWREYNCEP